MNENPSNNSTNPDPDDAGSSAAQNAPRNDGASADQRHETNAGVPQSAPFDPSSVPPRPDLPHNWAAPTAAPSYSHQGAAPGVHDGARDAFGQQTHPTPGYAPYNTDAAAAPVHHGADGGEKPKKRRVGAGLMVACLAIGAIVGGASGAGSFAIIDSMQQGTPVAEGSSDSSVVINNNEDVTQTTAIAAKAAPSVVTISVAGSQAAGSGSGIVLSEDGYVLTNNHVVTLDGATSDAQIQVTDDAGNIYSASIVGTDPIYDLAVIKLDDASELTPMSFGDSSEINVGDTAVAIGAPLGLSGTVTDGIVSALDRSITVASSAVPETPDENGGDENPYRFGLPGQDDTSSGGGTISLAVIQTDAAINPGNSGGALVDDEGKLIGVNVAIASAGSSESGSQSGSIGVGFAIPSSIAKRIADEIIENGEATHGLLGATVTDSSSDANATVAGALIKDITGGGAADEAGLKSGDVITEFDGVSIGNATDLTAQVRARASGSDATATYVRGGKKYQVDVTLGALKQ